ncbi:hypothetical protein Rs2_06941 [Raphanus sativus]|nr:hypothetical protein Rs2_06941 [Raphanus sativus]
MPPALSRYCLVDASWKDPNKCAGIGWSLLSKEGIQLIHGSSMINPTSSSLEAGAMALLMVVQQMRRLGYEHVTFMSDCMNLIDELYQHRAEQTISRKCIMEASSMIQDIVEISKPMGFMFWFVNRSML